MKWFVYVIISKCQLTNNHPPYAINKKEMSLFSNPINAGMEETIERTNANTHERSFRPQINSFSDFGKLDRTLYPTERKRLLTFFERYTTERVRNFRKTKRGIKNRGDFLRLSSSSSLSNVETDGQGRRVSTLSSLSYTSEDCFKENSSQGKRFRIVLYGIPGVGKSCFLKQMRTSEFLGTYPDGKLNFFFFSNVTSPCSYGHYINIAIFSS